MIISLLKLCPCFPDPKTHKWAKVAEVPSDTHDYPVNNLKEGEEYQFRVMSKNDQGLSPPLESAPITPLSPGEAPKVDPEVCCVITVSIFVNSYVVSYFLCHNGKVKV